MSAFKLLGQRRFLPFFVVQFLGALNDNLFKNAMVILIAFRKRSRAEELDGVRVGNRRTRVAMAVPRAGGGVLRSVARQALHVDDGSANRS